MSDFIHELKHDHHVIQQVVAGMSAVAELLDSGKGCLGGWVHSHRIGVVLVREATLAFLPQQRPFVCDTGHDK